MLYVIIVSSIIWLYEGNVKGFFWFWLTFNLIGLSVIYIRTVIRFYKRQNDKFYMNDVVIQKRTKDEIIWELPIQNIITIGTYNKSGKEGSIAFFDTEISKEYYLTPFISFFSGQPWIWGKGTEELYGFTKYKINFVLDRKKVVTVIYNLNNKIHFTKTN